LWRRRELNFLVALKTGNLLNPQGAQNAEHSKVGKSLTVY